MRFHLIDRIEQIEYGRCIEAVKCVTLTDDVFNEHFPGFPVFPGSLILEGLAQLGGAFFEIMMKQKGLPVKRAVLVLVQQLKFKRPVTPGDKVRYRAELISMQEAYGAVRVRAQLESGEICSEGELLFSFLDVQNEALNKSRDEIYDIYTRNMKVVQE
jgi:3-hydroxymyristoyl/3-hydroxydecanoyl-(acyl carrier protein) dehydratase